MSVEFILKGNKALLRYGEHEAIALTVEEAAEYGMLAGAENAAEIRLEELREKTNIWLYAFFKRHGVPLP